MKSWQPILIVRYSKTSPCCLCCRRMHISQTKEVLLFLLNGIFIAGRSISNKSEVDRASQKRRWNNMFAKIVEISMRVITVAVVDNLLLPDASLSCIHSPISFRHFSISKAVSYTPSTSCGTVLAIWLWTLSEVIDSPTTSLSPCSS